MTTALLQDAPDGGACYCTHQLDDLPTDLREVFSASGDFASSSVHSLETSAEKLQGIILTGYDPPRIEYAVTPISVIEATFRHSGWRQRRLKVWECLKRTGATVSRLDQFANCGAGAFVQVNEETGDVRLSASYCHDRLCLRCGQARGLHVARSIMQHCGDRLVRFVTLTLRHSRTPLADQIDRLFSCFNRLKDRQFWKQNVRGGVAFLEVKWIPATRMWHPHLHIICETPWLPQKELSQAWHGVTGDSFIVDVRPIPNQQAGVNYVAKYAGKPVEASVYQDAAALDEFATAIKGRRLYSKFGSWYGVELEPAGEHSERWVSLGSLRQLVDDARAGDPTAQRLLDVIERRDRHDTGPPIPP